MSEEKKNGKAEPEVVGRNCVVVESGPSGSAVTLPQELGGVRLKSRYVWTLDADGNPVDFSVSKVPGPEGDV